SQADACDFFIIERKSNMTNKEKSAKKLRETIDLFRCQICQSPIKVIDLKSLICPNNHTFDIAKIGYINMITRTTNSIYDKKLYEDKQHNNKGSFRFNK